ncbi:hypothetical protein Tco_0128258 [Tanacetum coccineum]
MIDQGVTSALAARDADRNTNGDDSHISRTGVRRIERTAPVNCNFTVFIKLSTLNSSTEGVCATWHSPFKFALNMVETPQVKTVGHDAAYGIGFVVREDVSRRI